jgi:hypothetical protein
LKLRFFCLTEDWIPLFRALGGWRQASADVWSDGESAVRIGDPGLGAAIGFSNPRQAGKGGNIVCTPSGLGIETRRSLGAGSGNEGSSLPYVLNHASIRTPLIDEDHSWFRALLGATTVLSKIENRNPVDGSVAPEAHLCADDSYYVTLRGSSQLRIDHIGWMARRRSLVDDAHLLIAGLGWKTVWGPSDLDGSYLVHFRGPDGRIHDIFYPTEELRAGAA